MSSMDFVPNVGDIVELCIGGANWYPALVIEMDHKPQPSILLNTPPYQFRCKMISRGEPITVWHPQLIRPI